MVPIVILGGAFLICLESTASGSCKEHFETYCKSQIVTHNASCNLVGLFLAKTMAGTKGREGCFSILPPPWFRS